jgi:hypothetical protein
MINKLYRKTLVFTLTTLFIVSAITPNIYGNFSKNNKQETLIKNQETSPLIFYTFNKTGSKESNANLSNDVVELITNKIQKLNYQIINHPLNEETKVLKKDLVETLDTYDLIPDGMSKDDVLKLLNPSWLNLFNKKTHTNFKEALIKTFKSSFNNPFIRYDNTASSSDWNILCNMGSVGVGMPLPLFMLPRPRGIALWFSSSGTTYASSLLTSKSFIAYGSQQGLALGFVGVGLTASFYGTTGYIFVGYAAYTMMKAENFEYYTPPNQEPEITNENPFNGAIDVPLTLSELSFKISDYENDPMDYTVTTNPYIGTGSGNNKKDGIYKIPVTGLVDNTKYTWKVSVNDDYSTIEKEYSFTTEAIAPIITNPIPSNGDNWVPVETTQLSFKLKDNQGDLIDYTVETSPDIGSSSGTNVDDGTYYLDITGLDQTTQYTWYVNATDGTHWTREIFNFKTQPKMVFDPFDEGWQHRKKITINYNQVADDLTDFPVLISKVDSDLKFKAQSDGDDILFMDGSGVANRLFHEIELFQDSNGELVAWVKIPELSDSANTILYMYYGNPTCSSQQYPEKVWNSNFNAVWHLNNNPTGSIFDSTANDNDATAHGSMNSSNLVEGKGGKCLQFDGINDYVGAPDSGSLCPTNVMLSGWYKPIEFGEGGYVISKCSFDYWGNADGHTYGFRISSDNILDATFEREDSQQYDVTDNFSTYLNQWYYLTLTYDDTANIGSLYVNGVLHGSVSQCHSTVLWYNQPWDFIIGASKQHEGSSKIPNYFQNCAVDEVHVLNTAKTSGWIATEYNNQNDPLSFLSFGPEETIP